MRNYDVLVIGAGAVGALSARALTERGLRVAVLEADADAACGASGANSGIVHAGYDALPGTRKAALNIRGAAMMEALAAELGVPYRRNGALVCAKKEETGILSGLLRRGQENGVSGLSVLGREELHALEPGLAGDLVAALLAESSAVISPYRLTIAALGSAMDNGAAFFPETPVISLSREGGDWMVNGEFRAPLAVNAAGIHADTLAALAGEPAVRQHARRGEYLLLDRTCGTLLSHTVFRAPTARGKGILLSPTADGNLILGPTAEEQNDRESRATTAAGLAAVERAAREVLPGLPRGAVITSFAGLRAAGETGDFEITERNGLLSLIGIESPGLTAAPAIAELVADTLAGGRAKLPSFVRSRTPYDWFRRLTREEQSEQIRRDPAFGRMVCRCEEVTEGELLFAMRQNPPARTLDALKRRVSAGAGRCQGSFCTPGVLALLAREAGVSPLAVTKRGRGSELCVAETKRDGEDLS